MFLRAVFGKCVGSPKYQKSAWGTSEPVQEDRHTTHQHHEHHTPNYDEPPPPPHLKITPRVKY